MKDKKRFSSILSLAVFSMGVAIGSSNQAQVWKPTKKWLEEKPQFFWQPDGGYVGSKETAIVIGTAVLRQTFGKKAVHDAGRFDAERIDDIWVVYSQQPTSSEGYIIPGGIMTAQLDNTTGAVMNVTMGH